MEPMMTFDGFRVLPLMIDKYENVVQKTAKQNEDYKKKLQEIKSHVHDLIAENMTLTADLKSSLEARIEKAERSKGFSGGDHADSLQQQLEAATEEKENLQEMWQQALREIERLEQQLQLQQVRPEVTLLQDQIVEIKNQYEKVILTLHGTINKLNDNVRKCTNDVENKTYQVSEMHLLLETTKEQMLQKNKENMSLETKDKMLMNTLQNMQELVISSKQTMANLTRENIELKEHNIRLQEEVTLLSSLNQNLDEKTQRATNQVKDSIQMSEDALLEKDHILLKLKHSEEEVSRLKKGLSQILEEAGIRTKKEVDQVKNLHQHQMHCMSEEIQKLQLANSELLAEMKHLKSKLLIDDKTERSSFSLQQTELQLAYVELQNRMMMSESRKNAIAKELELANSKIYKAEQNLADERNLWMSERRILDNQMKNVKDHCLELEAMNVSVLKSSEELHRQNLAFQLSCDVDKKKLTKKNSLLEQQLREKDKVWTAKLEDAENMHQQLRNDLKRQLIAQEKSNIKLKLAVKTSRRYQDMRLSTAELDFSRHKSRMSELASFLEEHKNFHK